MSVADFMEDQCDEVKETVYMLVSQSFHSPTSPIDPSDRRISSEAKIEDLRADYGQDKHSGWVLA